MEKTTATRMASGEMSVGQRSTLEMMLEVESPVGTTLGGVVG